MVEFLKVTQSSNSMSSYFNIPNSIFSAMQWGSGSCIAQGACNLVQKAWIWVSICLPCCGTPGKLVTSPEVQVPYLSRWRKKKLGGVKMDLFYPEHTSGPQFVLSASGKMLWNLSRRRNLTYKTPGIFIDSIQRKKIVSHKRRERGHQGKEK